MDLFLSEKGRSNNTNKLSPQELEDEADEKESGSNNTNKLSPQEHFGLW